MPDYNKLHDLCADFVDNIDGWCELDDGDMIDKLLSEMKTALLLVESPKPADNSQSAPLCACGQPASKVLCDDCFCDEVFAATKKRA